MKWYKLELETKEPVIIGHENSGTEKYINGNAIRGLFVKELEEKIKSPDTKLKFSKDIVFYDAYLLEDGKEYIPSPMTFEVNKHEYKKFQNSRSSEINIINKLKESTRDKSPVKIKAPYIFLEDKKAIEGNIELKEKLHINLKNKKENKNDENIIFRYEAIEKNQKFYFFVKINDKNSSELEKIFKEIFGGGIKKFKIGKSRSTGYGEVEINLIKETTEPFNNINMIKDRKDGKLLLLYFFTKAIFRDKFGDTTFSPCDELKAIFGNDKVELKRSFVSTEVFGGYNSFWNLELPKEVGISAGSIYEYRITNLDSDKIKQIEENGLGYFKERGFGLVLVLVDIDLDVTILKSKDTANKGINIMVGIQPKILEKEIESLKKLMENKIKNKKIEKEFYHHISHDELNLKVIIDKEVSTSKLYQLIDILDYENSIKEIAKDKNEYNNEKLINILGYTVVEFITKIDEDPNEIIKKLELYSCSDVLKEDNKKLKELFKEIIRYKIRARKGGE